MKCRIPTLLCAVLSWGLFLIAPSAHAHSQSYGFLHVRIGDNGVSGQLELAVRDLDIADGIDANGDGKVTWGELRQRESEISSQVLQGITIGPDDARCKLVADPISVDSRGGETYVLFPFKGICGDPGSRIKIGYDLMFDIDAQHRGLVDVTRGDIGRTAVMTPEARAVVLEIAPESLRDVIGAFLAHGVHHIWTGYDHMLFLVTLLLSAVLVRSGKEWLPAKDLKDAAWAAASVVTAFTLAHSITLSVAAFGIVALPSRLTESAIAATVAVAAVNNLFPLVTRRIWIAAFLFGLVHGFGFASVLAELGLPPARKLAALFSFNLGVELGQLAVVAVVLPALFAIRRTAGYRRMAMPVGSVAIAVIGALWFLQRVTDAPLIPG